MTTAHLIKYVAIAAVVYLGIYVNPADDATPSTQTTSAFDGEINRSAGRLLPQFAE